MINPIAMLPGADWQHPSSRLQSAWNWTRVGFAIFPLLPSVGAVTLLIATIKTWRQAGNEICSHRLNWGFALLSSWLIGVSLFSPYLGDALLGLANFLPFFWMFAAQSTLIQSPAQLRQLAGIFLIPAVPVMLLGLGQMCGWGVNLPVPGLPIVVMVISAGGEPLGRMSSVFAHANPLTVYLQMVFIFGLGLLADAHDRLGTSKLWRAPTGWWLLSVLGLTVVSLILTNSRSGWGVALLASLVFTIYRRWYWLISGVTAIAGLILSAAYAPAPAKAPLRAIVPRYFWARITDEMYPDRPTDLTRLSQWKFAWQMTQDRPITGWGLQSFGYLYQQSTHIWLGYPHNLLLMLSSNLGIPTTVALFSLVGWIIVQGTTLLLDFPAQWQAERTMFLTYIVAFVGFIISNVADVTTLELRLNTHAWLILASIYGLVLQARRSSAESLLRI